MIATTCQSCGFVARTSDEQDEHDAITHAERILKNALFGAKVREANIREFTPERRQHIRELTKDFGRGYEE
jgi:hypothetical protein